MKILRLVPCRGAGSCLATRVCPTRIWARCRKDHFTRSRSNAWQWACLPLDFPLIRRVACWMQATSQFRDSTQPEIQRRGSTSAVDRSEEHTSELQSLMRISYAVFCLQKKTTKNLV